MILHAKNSITTGRFAAVLLFFVTIALGFAATAFAETLYVKKSGTKLQAADSPKSDVLATLNAGTPVNVLQRGKRFFQVSAAGKKGWIFKFKLTAKAPQASGGDGDLLGALGGRQKIAARESSSGSSIRGLSPMAEERAKNKGTPEANIRAVKQMENFKVSAEELDRFLEQGSLGAYAQ